MAVEKPKLGRLGEIRRQPLSRERVTEVRRSFLNDRQLPLVIEPVTGGASLATWVAAYAEEITRDLHRYGAILFRGFNVTSPEEFDTVIHAASGEPFAYKERSSPRTAVHGHIYTSTEYPPSQEIFFHNENSYAHTWPRRLFFCCLVSAESGGETPLADVRRVYDSLPGPVRARFETHGVKYVRNYSERLGLSWQTVFQTDDAARAEAYARASGYATEWRDTRLRTSRIAPATYVHPHTGERIWFNHAAFFHLTTLDPLVQQGLLAQCGADDLPNQTYVGDGSAIEAETADALRRAYRENSVAFSWVKGDVLFVDNMLVAHARASFKGPRKVLVGMSDPWSAGAGQEGA